MATEQTATPPDDAAVTAALLADAPELEVKAEEASEPTDDKPALVLKKKTKEKEPVTPIVAESARATHPEFRQLQKQDDVNLRQFIEGLGAGETVRLDIIRKEPRFFSKNGKRYNTAGHCGSYNELVDEERIKEDYGGGHYTIRINTPGKNGSLTYFKARDIKIAGDPIPADLEADEPTTVAAPSGGGEMGKLATKIVESQLSGGGKLDDATRLLIEKMREDSQAAERRFDLEMKRRDEEAKAIREELARERRAPQEQDTFKDKMLSGLMDAESTRMSSMRANHESELRQLKEGHKQEVDRLNDRHDRDITRLESNHERSIGTLTEGHKREMDMIKMSHDNALATAKASADMQKELFSNEKNRANRELEKLSDENKELRAKKDKTPVEMIKDANALRDLIGGDSEEKEDSIGNRLVEAAPMIIEQLGQTIGRVTGKGNQQAAAQQQQQQQPAQPRRPVIIQDPQGNRFVQHGNQMIPVKKKPRVVQLPTDTGEVTQVEIPDIDPQKVEFAVNYLERAYASNSEPDNVAISIRPHIPEEILTAISNLGGIDQFMVRVAKLPGSSPLAQQAGKNWLRKVGKALVGD